MAKSIGAPKFENAVVELRNVTGIYICLVKGLRYLFLQKKFDSFFFLSSEIPSLWMRAAISDSLIWGRDNLVKSLNAML